jgi:hypothetical protein
MTLNPRDWDEITDEKTRDEEFVTWNTTWMEIGDAVRIYDSSMYVKVDGGWLEFEVLIEELKAFNDAMQYLPGDVIEKGYYDDE